MKQNLFELASAHEPIASDLRLALPDGKAK